MPTTPRIGGEGQLEELRQAWELPPNPPAQQPSQQQATRSKKEQKGREKGRTEKQTKHIPSTLLISEAPKPVRVRLCLGREMPAGPTDPWMSTIGAPTDGRRSLVGILSDAMLSASIGFVWRACSWHEFSRGIWKTGERETERADKVEKLALVCFGPVWGGSDPTMSSAQL